MPVVTAKVYKTIYELAIPFQSASGALKNKEILQVIFSNAERDGLFIYELPLSPSLGMMPIDVIRALDQNGSRAFFTNQMLSRALSYFCGMQLLQRKLPFLEKPMSIIQFKTFSIGKYPQQFEHLARLKCDAKNLQEVINYSQRVTTDWAVDFNGSLNLLLWEKFLKEADLSYCKWVEQPFGANVLDKTKSDMCPIPLYVDEEMIHFSAPKEFLLSPYKGFVIKPIRYDFDNLCAWLLFAQEYNIPCMVGAPVCDRVSKTLCEIVNDCCTVQLKGRASAQKECYKSPAEVSSIIKKDVDYVKSHYTLVKQFEHIEIGGKYGC